MSVRVTELTLSSSALVSNVGMLISAAREPFISWTPNLERPKATAIGLWKSLGCCQLKHQTHDLASKLDSIRYEMIRYDRIA